jgi:hypothetical protein
MSAAGLMLTGLVALPSSAAAAVTTVDAEPETQVTQAGGSASFTGTYSEDSPVNMTGIAVAFVSGSRGDGGNGVNVADDTATEDQVGNTFSYSYTPTSPGTDVLRFFADNDGDEVLDPGEAFDEVSVSVAGSPVSVDMQPEVDSSAVGSCQLFTVASTDGAGVSNPGRSIVVDISQPTEASVATPNIFFCDPNGSAISADPAGQTPSYDPNTGATASTVRRLVVTTGTQGQPAVFGVGTTQQGTMSLIAFADTNGNGSRQDGEPSDAATEAWTTGRPDSVESLNAEPETDTAFQGQTVSFSVVTTNAAGDTVPNVTPLVKVTGANAQQIPCRNSSGTTQSTGNDGMVTCTYPATNAGSDTIVVFVQQSDGATSGPDPTEPQDEITRTIATAPSGDLTVTLVCSGSSANASTTACVNPSEDGNDLFTATVTGPDGGDTGSDRDPVAGVIVDFTISATGANASDNDATLSAASGSTSATGTAQTLVTNPSPANGDSVTVTVTIRGQQDTDPIFPGTQGPSTASATTQWQTRHAASLALRPEVVTAQTNTTATFTAAVRDQFGSVVPNQNVDFVIEGGRSANNSTTLGKDQVTDASGEVSFTFTDLGPRDVSSDNTVRAWADVTENDLYDGAGEPQDTATAHFTTESVAPYRLDLDVDGTCNPSTSSPATDQNDARAVTFDAEPRDDAYPICALVQNANGSALAGSLVTFSASGVGVFVNPDGSSGGQETTAYTDGSGIAHLSVRSDGAAGTQTINATDGSAGDAGTLTYKAAAAQARSVDLSPASTTVAPGSVVQLTASVTDRFGNPVEGVNVSFAESGPGAFQGGATPQTANTDAAGHATARVTSTSSEQGTETVTATIDQAVTDCERSTDDPAGAAAGRCTDSAMVTYKTLARLAVTRPSSYYTTIAGGTALTFSGTGGKSGERLVVHRKIGNGGYTTFAGPVVRANGTWSYPLGVTTITAVYFSGVNGTTAVRVIKTRLNVTSPSSYYTNVAKGSRVAMYGSGARPGEYLYVYRKVGNGAWQLLSDRPRTTSYGTWAYRPVITATTAYYFRGRNGLSDTVVYRAV